MQIIAKTGFDISNVKSSNVKSCLLGKNMKKNVKMLSAEKKKRKKKRK